MTLILGKQNLGDNFTDFRDDHWQYRRILEAISVEVEIKKESLSQVT